MNNKITQLIPFESNGNQMFIEVGKKIPFYNKVIESIEIISEIYLNGHIDNIPCSYGVTFEDTSFMIVPFDKYLSIYEEVEE